MKKCLIIILLMILICSNIIFGQGRTRTPYDTTGWSLAHGRTPHYGLYIFDLFSKPGGRTNINIRTIDSLFYKSIVYTDPSQFKIVNDTLIFSDSLSYNGAFATTDTVDSVTVLGADSLDVAVVSAREVNPQAYLWVQLKNNLAIINRSEGTVSGLKYNFIWIRKYD